MTERRRRRSGFDTLHGLDRRVDEELRGHFEELVEEGLQRGLPRAQAERRALHRFGDLENALRASRRVRRTRLRRELRASRCASVITDARWAVRSLRAQPKFAVAALVLLGLGIGASTALFSVVQGVLLAPLPFERSERLVLLDHLPLSTTGQVNRATALDWHARVRTAFVEVAAYHPAAYSVNLSGPGEPLQGGLTEVSPNFFQVLGQRMLQGRYFTDADLDAPLRPVVVSERIWRRNWGADAGIVGDSLSINGRPHRLLGVVPENAQLPESADVWVVQGFEPDDVFVGGARYFDVVARLADGVDLETARHQLRALQEVMDTPLRESGAQRMNDFALTPLREAQVGSARAPLTLLLLGVALLLGAALINLAGYLLTRQRRREAEFEVRAALGASSGRLLQQAILEALALTLPGAALGSAVAAWSVALLRASNVVRLPRLQELAVDWRLYAFAAVLAIVSALVLGVAPGLRAARMGAGSRRLAAHRGGRARDMLAVLQVTVAVVLVAGAAVLVRTYGNLRAVDSGFSARSLTFALNLDERAFPEVGDWSAFVDELGDRVRALPGVHAAGAANVLPLAQHGLMGFGYDIKGSEPGRTVYPVFVVATPEYLAALGVEVTRGRPLLSSDVAGAPRVALVNRQFAVEHLGGADPLGMVLVGRGEEAEQVRIVGVVGDQRRVSPGTEPYAEIFLPMAQTPVRPRFFAVSADRASSDLAAAIREVVRELRPTLPMFDVRFMSERLDGALMQPRLMAWLFGAFGAVSVLLAAFGLYVAVAHWVSARTHEIGVRLAIGATRRSVVGAFLASGTLRVAIGAVLGAFAFWTLSRSIDVDLLYGVESSDPFSLAASIVFLVVVATSAIAAATVRVARLNAVDALRLAPEPRR